MNLQHVNVKVFVEGQPSVDWKRLIEIFHRWVAEQSLEELLVDVADYRHVHHGPGVLLVGLEADYSLDQRGGRLGLRYNRKAALAGSNADRLRQAFRAAAKACRLLESELPGLRFSRRQFQVWINDRALAPNTADTFAAARPDIEAFLKNDFKGAEFDLRHDADPRHLFTVEIQTARPIDFAAVWPHA